MIFDRILRVGIGFGGGIDLRLDLLGKMLRCGLVSFGVVEVNGMRIARNVLANGSYAESFSASPQAFKRTNV